MKEIAKALLVAMNEIGYLQKDKHVGTATNGYKGLTDQKATQACRSALMNAGIVAIPVDVQEETKLDTWLGTSNSGYETMKVHVFTKVKMTYMLIHAESGESVTVQAIGHGIDSGDKGAGKAMTYAKKNALLNSLLISTGLDADDTHSDDLPTPPPPAKQTKPAPAKQTKPAPAKQPPAPVEEQPRVPPAKETPTPPADPIKVLMNATYQAITNEMLEKEQKISIVKLITNPAFNEEQRTEVVKDLNNAKDAGEVSAVIDSINLHLNSSI